MLFQLRPWSVLYAKATIFLGAFFLSSVQQAAEVVRRCLWLLVFKRVFGWLVDGYLNLELGGRLLCTLPRAPKRPLRPKFFTYIDNTVTVCRFPFALPSSDYVQQERSSDIQGFAQELPGKVGSSKKDPGKGPASFLKINTSRRRQVVCAQTGLHAWLIRGR